MQNNTHNNEVATRATSNLFKPKKLQSSLKMLSIYSLLTTSSFAQAASIMYSFDSQSPVAATSHASTIAHDAKLFAEESNGTYSEAPLTYTFDSRNNPPGDYSHTSVSINSPSKYLSVTLQVNPGWRIDLTSLSMMIDHQSSSLGDYVLRWTAYGIGMNAQSRTSNTSDSGLWNLDETLLFPIISPSSTEATFGDSIEFRIAASSIEDPMNIIDLNVDNMRIQYDAYQVPEPSSSVLLGLGAVSLLMRRKR